MRFPEDVNDDVLKRLRRLEGQIRGVQRMIEEGKDCTDVVTQLSACKAALDRVGYRLVVASWSRRRWARSPDSTPTSSSACS
jgi:DNA-binding FrmR family transcriptional regulator